MKKLYAFISLLFIIQASFAQMNVIKMNVAGLAISNLSFQYERNLNENRSLALTFAYLNKMELPKKMREADPALEALTISGYSIMPEIRFYPNDDKIMPRGGYVGLYGKYNAYEFTTQFESKTFSNTYYPIEEGKYMAFGGGVNFGIQWLIKDRVSIDWNIFGIHGGFSKSSASLTSSFPIPATDQADLKARIESIEIPLDLGSVKADVDAGGADVEVDVIFLGLRAGLSIGFAF